MIDPAAALDGLLRARTGHFLLESGHHGELWLELPALYLSPARVAPLARLLAERLRPHGIEAVCGPLVEGAFVALTLAEVLGVPFTYAQPVASGRGGLFPVDYRLPPVVRAAVRGRRVAVVNDVVNAGSAVRGALADLRAAEARPVALGTLMVLGEAAGRLVVEQGLILETLVARPNTVWEPAQCPACAGGMALDPPE